MSATHDKSQKTTFVYSNLYTLYRQGKDLAKEAQVPASSRVLKADDLKNPAFAVRPFRPAEFLEKRITQAPVLVSRSQAVESLKTNLKQLNDLHDRLRFMLQEIEELSRDEE